MTSFAVCDCLDTRDSQNSRVISVTQTSWTAWIPEIRSTPVRFQLPKLLGLLASGSQRLTVACLLRNGPQVLDWVEIWADPRSFQERVLAFLQGLGGSL